MVLITEVDEYRIAIITWEIDEPSDLLEDLKDLGLRCRFTVSVTDAFMDSLEEYAELDYYDDVDPDVLGIDDGKFGFIDIDIIKSNFSKLWDKIDFKMDEIDD